MQKKTSIIALIPILIILLSSFAAYFDVLFGQFVYDDEFQIVTNYWLRNIRNIPTIFSKSVWSFQPGVTISNYYRPLMHIVYMLNYYLFGLKPWGFHLVNILFHCGVSVLVFLIIRKFVSEHRVLTSSAYLSPPFIAAMLFALHPIHTEAVTWIAGLPDVAFTFFYLLSFYLYIRSKAIPSGSYLFSVACFAIAAFFKEPALTMPVLLYAYDLLFQRGQSRFPNYVKRYLPYLLIGIVYVALRIHALGAFAPEEMHVTLSAYQYGINVLPLFIKYLGKLLLPINLNAFYVFHPIFSLFEVKGVLSLIATLVFVIILPVALKKNRVVFLGLLLMTVPLLPTLYIPALGENTFADRYLYLPSVGYVLILAIFLSWAMVTLPRAVGSITIISMIIIGGLYAAGTIDRNNVWKDNFNLWSDTVRKSPDSAMVHNNLGVACASKSLQDMAITEFQAALRLDPDYANAHNNLGLAYASKGLMDMAITEFQAALRLDPDYADAHNNLGNACLSKGMFDVAITEFQTALRLNFDHAKAHYNLARAYLKKGTPVMARKEVEEVLKIRPDLNAARRLLGDINSRQH